MEYELLERNVLREKELRGAAVSELKIIGDDFKQDMNITLLGVKLGDIKDKFSAVFIREEAEKYKVNLKGETQEIGVPITHITLCVLDKTEGKGIYEAVKNGEYVPSLLRDSKDIKSFVTSYNIEFGKRFVTIDTGIDTGYIGSSSLYGDIGVVFDLGVSADMLSFERAENKFEYLLDIQKSKDNKER